MASQRIREIFREEFFQKENPDLPKVYESGLKLMTCAQNLDHQQAVQVWKEASNLFEGGEFLVVVVCFCVFLCVCVLLLLLLLFW